MSCFEIAELLGCRHDNENVTIEQLVAKGVISTPARQQYLTAHNRTFTEYRIGKRDIYLIVAQISPEFTARLVDRGRNWSPGCPTGSGSSSLLRRSSPSGR